MPDSPWREIHLDAGWYGDRFRVVLLDPDWDHLRRSAETDEEQATIAACEDADLLRQWTVKAVTATSVRDVLGPRAHA